MKSQEKAKVEPMVEKMQECARKFRASDCVLSDVGFI
jgi:hypothetical protein